MSFRLKLAVTGNLTKAMEAQEARIAKAVTDGVGETADGAQGEYVGQIKSAGLGTKLPRTVRQLRFPRNKNSMGASAVVYTKAPEIIRAFNSGSVILPKKGKFLCIPTQFNLNLGRRKSARAASWAGVRVTPEEMIKSGAAFTRPRKDGPGLIWLLTVTKAMTRAQRVNKKTGKITYYSPRTLAYAGGIVPIGGGRRQRVQAALDAGAVPMFTLLPQVRLRKSLDIARIRSVAERRLPRLIRYKLDQGGDFI